MRSLVPTTLAALVLGLAVAGCGEESNSGSPTTTPAAAPIPQAITNHGELVRPTAIRPAMRITCTAVKTRSLARARLG